MNSQERAKKKAEMKLMHASLNPYDASDAWRDGPGGNDNEDDYISPPPPPAIDWAHAVARGVMEVFLARSGLDDVLGQLDEETRVEIVADVAEIIRVAETQKK